MSNLAVHVALCYPHRLGGVYVVNEALASELEARGFQVTKVYSYRTAIALLLTRSDKKRVWVTNLTFGVLNLFVGKSLFILHGFPRISEGAMKFTISRFAFRLFSRFATRVVSVSYQTHNINTQVLGVRSDLVIHNYLAVPPTCVRAKTSFNVPPNIIYVGRLVAAKRPDVLLDAYLRISARSDVGKLVLVGEGPLDARLRVAAAGCPKVEIKGSLPLAAVYAELAAADIFASLHEMEPFGIAALEAAQHGLIVCAVAGSGPNEFLDSSNMVRVLDAGDAAGVAAALATACRLCEKRLPQPVAVENFRRMAADQYESAINQLAEVS